MILNPYQYVSGGTDSPILLVTVTGATPTSVAATKSGVTKALEYDSTLGKWWAALPSTGTWTVTASGNIGNTKSTTVLVSAVAIYETSLQLSNVPDGFTELEYIGANPIENTTTGPTGPRLILDFIPNNEIYGYALKVNNIAKINQRPSWAASYFGLFNTRGSSLGIIQASSSYNYLTAMNGVSINYQFSPATENTYDISCKDGSLKINNSQVAIYTPTAATTTMNEPTMIFGSGSSSSWQRYRFNLFYFKIWTGNTLTIDLVPVKCNEQTIGYNGTEFVTVPANTVGAIDMVSRTFYINAGDNSFVAGPEVA